MTETEVVIEFDCCYCQNQITAKLKCSGKGVSEGPHAVAGANLPCPICHQVNHVWFELTGLVLRVAPPKKGQRLLQPSVN